MAATTIAAIAGFGAAANALFNAGKKPKSLPAPSPLAPPPDPFSAASLPDRNIIGQRRRQAAFAAPPPSTLLSGPDGLQQNAAVNRSTLLGR